MTDRYDDRDFFDGSGYDRETVRFFDVAHEGAQIRSVAAAVDKLSDLRGYSPRSIVVLSPDYLTRQACELAISHCEPLRAPIVVTDRLPTFVGALDVVIAVTDRGDDPDLAQALITATGRGAETIVAGPARGPLVDDIPTRARVIPALPTAAGFSPARAITTVIAVLESLEGPEISVGVKLAELADNVDAEIALLSPERDDTINPGRALRSFVHNARIVHTGPGEYEVEHSVGTRAAEFCAHLWTARDLVSGHVHPADLPELLAEENTANSHDIFHDPFLDEPEGLIPLKVIVWAAKSTEIPNALAVSVDATTRPVGRLDTTLRLVTRALAATTYTDPE